MADQSTRYHDLDALRAFAMFLGLVLHGLLSFMPVPFWPAQDVSQNPEVNGLIVALIHGFRMALFFFPERLLHHDGVEETGCWEFTT